MIPKEILDAVDLQPKYRTFSEIRDSLLQQLRREMCSIRQRKLVQSRLEWAQTRALPLPHRPQLRSQWTCHR